MNIKRVRARRFLCFGEEWADIDFTKLGKVISIKGENLDYGPGHSNGSGKSSCLEALVYGLYGKLLKGLNHKNANHIHSKKGLEIEIWVDDMFIRRTRSPDTLIIEIDGKPAEVGGLTSTQEEINKRLKLNYDGFKNVAVFGQHSLSGFLESEAAEKRKIAENLLGLDDYARFHEIAKKQKAFLTDSIRELSSKYESHSDVIRRVNSRLMGHRAQQSQWIESRNNEIKDINDRIISIQDEIKDLSSDGIDSETCRKETERIDSLIKEKDKRRNDLLKVLKECEPKIEALKEEYESASLQLSKFQAELQVKQQNHRKKKQDIDQVEASKGKRCPRCLSTVREENINLMTEGLKSDFVESGKVLEGLLIQIDQLKSRTEDLGNRYKKIHSAYTKAKQEQSAIINIISSLTQERLNYTKLPVTAREAALVKECEMHNNRIISIVKEKENDPFRTLILTAESEIAEAKNQSDEIRIEVSHKEKLMPYYEYWVKGFGDKGIRSFLFEERLPALNSRINHWLQILIDNRLKMSFDRDLNETIRRFPDDNKRFVYNSLSGGELRRIDLAISQAFAYITSISSGKVPSICILDEVGVNFDRPGILAVYKMIQEIARDRQVIVITHDTDLLEILGNTSTITAKMKNGITSLEIKP